MGTNTITNINIEAFGTPGERLNHILDQIGFKQGRGRVTEFHSFLSETSPEAFSDLKYTTVRSWFGDHAPPMRKINAAIQSLQTEFKFNHNISQIKTWWKVGGFYPFSVEHDESTPSVSELQQSSKENEEKLIFIVMSLITEETGTHFHSLPGSELVKIKDKAIEFAKDFSDPFKTNCPERYIRMAIKEELSSILNKSKKC
ncbi:hypothetical protein [Hahella ganghwensis]|uniref:hypothetical protein n=1 Tax=Hahella ganghwensis TaxID=286420 RepID=UPI000379D5A8|nr:hypothetical protein [Hahella ganghwensis]